MDSPRLFELLVFFQEVAGLDLIQPLVTLLEAFPKGVVTSYMHENEKAHNREVTEEAHEREEKEEGKIEGSSIAQHFF